MKLAILLRDNPETTFNGLSTYCREITKELRKKHEVEWFIGKTDWGTLKLGAKIPKGFDLVYATSLPYGAWVKMPMVAKCNSPLKEEGEYYGGLKKVAGFLGQYAEVSTLNRARAVVSVSKVSHDILLKEYNAESTVIPDGVDLERFKPEKEGGVVKAMFCTRDDPRKNLPLTYRALEYLDGNVETFVCLGGWPRDAIEFGYKKSDIFIATSLSEAFNISLLEGMASGCACLASDIPAHRELIEDGHDGIIFKDEYEMKHWLDALIEGPWTRSQLGTHARKKAEGYSWAHSAELLEKVFEEALKC